MYVSKKAKNRARNNRTKVVKQVKAMNVAKHKFYETLANLQRNNKKIDPRQRVFHYGR